MGMLERIKKKQFDGFKDFVQNLEITGMTTRAHIFTTGVLEDPNYMTWVMKNIRTFEDFMKLPGGEINAVLSSHEQLVGILAKCLHGQPPEAILELESAIPKYLSRLKDEISYLKEVTASEREGAKYFLVKTARKLQSDEQIIGFHWKLPPLEIFQAKVLKDGAHETFYESGTLAAFGEVYRGRKRGTWKHNYETGQMMAEGEYLEGLKTGDWIFYYSNGNIKSQGQYREDNKHGTWKDWDRNGESLESHFTEGVKDG